MSIFKESFKRFVKTQLAIREAINTIGNNINTDAPSLLPPASSSTQNLNNVTTTWTGLDANSMPNFTVVDPTQAWQFTSTLSQPGMKSQTIITRTTDITSVTDTVSTFSQ